ncbi:MAG: phage tail sheath family protein [Rhodobacteraceae bacterium]|nr:phage tail sheath family protein [Paracoccaceae bacterium]
MYKHPGVYIEHVPSNALSIEAASTSVTVFVGHLKRGARVTDTKGDPIFISSVSQYAQNFGPVGGGAGGIWNNGSNSSDVDSFGHAVNSFYANGGSKAYIVPVSSTAGIASTCTVVVKEVVDAGQDIKHTIDFAATSVGKWADTLLVKLKQEETGDFTLTIGTQTEDSLAEADPVDKEFDTVLETFTGLSLAVDNGQSIEGMINDVSTLLAATIKATANAVAGDPIEAQAATSGGTDTNAPNTANFTKAFDRLRDYRDISIIVLPGQDWVSNPNVYEAAITHAEFMQNRMVLVDPESPSSTAKQLITAKDVKDTGFPTSPYTALYYPYLKVANPYYDAETAAHLPATFDLGPAAMAAGLWGRIDGSRGVWKAPAGLEATVRGALGPTVLIGNDLQDNLNEWGVNCIRSIIGPSVVWGGRTLATKSKPQYRYIPVRRTQNMIGESLYGALQAVVFEPNDHKLWSALRASVGDFMDGLHRSGAFQGAKASDAYFVNCGLGSTMTQGDIDGGIVRVVVGFAPLKPAEFVVVQIQQKVGQAS